MADAFGPRVVLTAKLRDGSLRQAAAKAGVKILLYEGGEALRFDDAAIDMAVQGTLRLAEAPGHDRQTLCPFRRINCRFTQHPAAGCVHLKAEFCTACGALVTVLAKAKNSAR